MIILLLLILILILVVLQSTKFCENYDIIPNDTEFDYHKIITQEPVTRAPDLSIFLGPRKLVAFRYLIGGLEYYLASIPRKYCNKYANSNNNIATMQAVLDLYSMFSLIKAPILNEDGNGLYRLTSNLSENGNLYLTPSSAKLNIPIFLEGIYGESGRIPTEKRSSMIELVFDGGSGINSHFSIIAFDSKIAFEFIIGGKKYYLTLCTDYTCDYDDFIQRRLCLTDNPGKALFFEILLLAND